MDRILSICGDLLISCWVMYVKQCSSNPQPTRLLKTHVDILSLFFSHLVSWSLQHGVVPANMKSAYVTPVVKKAGMNPVDVKSYSPILNLSVLSKLLERFVSKQLVKYLTDNHFPDRQSVYRRFHFTETSVLRVLTDMSALDCGDLAMLTLLDLLAAFDTVDHHTLLNRLQKSYGHGRAVYVTCGLSAWKPELPPVPVFVS